MVWTKMRQGGLKVDEVISWRRAKSLPSSVPA
jgi:hypothetical protein